MNLTTEREPVEGFVEVPQGRLHHLDWGGSGPQIHFLHANCPYGTAVCLCSCHPEISSKTKWPVTVMRCQTGVSISETDIKLFRSSMQKGNEK